MKISLKIACVTLGCPKNDVDSEILIRMFEDEGAKIVEDIHEADIVFVNTCGFIQDAKEESIEMILQLEQLKDDGFIDKLYVWGCLAERYKDEIQDEFSEVDGFFGIESFEVIRAKLFPKSEKKSPDLFYSRSLTTPRHLAYLKISEGCDHPCTFCAIPNIKGSYRSRSLESLIEEANELAEKGVKELSLIAQDTSQYGLDLEPKLSLPILLTELVKIEKIDWIRIMYMHPAHVSDELLQIMSWENKICNYLDMPLQHISDHMLSAMKRKPSKEGIINLLNRVKIKIPGVTLRTAFIVGFPGETDEDFWELMDFVRETEFDRMGVFQFSSEEGTDAAELSDQVSDEIKEQRVDKLMLLQQKISLKKNEGLESKILKVMIDEVVDSEDQSIGRTQGDAYEVDQVVYVDGKLEPGKIYPVRIHEGSEYDLFGHVVEED